MTMIVEATELPDVKILQPKIFEDARGYFYESFRETVIEELARDVDFVQDNQSYSKDAYTVRGLHYQAPPHAQDKLVRVVKGSVFDVAVDVRKTSKTYGEWIGVELSAENHKQLFVPKGFLHGFMTLEPETVVVYKVTDYYDGASDGAVFWASTSLGIDWPMAGERAILSEKDAGATDFSDFASPF